MKRSMSFDLLQTLKRGAEKLNAEARQQVCHYVESQRVDGEAYMNRGGQPDLYYTMFGWMLCYALGIRSDASQRKAYLQTIDAGRLDELHQIVWTLCGQLDRLLSVPRFTQDVILSLMVDDEPLRRFFKTYQQHGSGDGTNALAARLAIAAERDVALTDKLLELQVDSGGFLAYEGAPVPDMLSTAVAMFALSRQKIVPRYDVHSFVEAHWQRDGSFAATLLDEQGDVEYVFYGLLAIGSL